MILSLVPEGTQVKKGDVLCRLDASEYEELVRTQEIKSEQAKARALRQAELNFDVASGRLAVREYRDGLLPAKRSRKSMEGMIIPGQVRPGAIDRPPVLDQEDAREGLCIDRRQGECRA